MQLYTVHFSTKQIVSQFNAKGQKTGEYQLDYPQTLHALPLTTAQQYKTCDNYSIEPYFIEAHKQAVNSFKPKSRPDYSGAAKRGKTFTKKAAKSSVSHAAETGDLAAALNEAY
jgi:hypothetical protein